MQSLTRNLRFSMLALAAFALAALSGGLGAVSAPNHQTTTPLPTPTHPILLTDPIPDPQQPDVQWFAPTGHTLDLPTINGKGLVSN